MNGPNHTERVLHVGYPAYEQIMINLAQDRDWSFSFHGETVPIETVFNQSTYGPIFLTAIANELQLRQIGCDIAVALHGDTGSIFGARAEFDAERNSAYAQLWRLLATATMVESLPVEGAAYVLDALPGVLPAHFREFLEVPSAQDAD